MASLAGKVALVTGAARGQGRAHALRLARDGADLALIDIAAEVSPEVPYSPAKEADLEETVRAVEALDRRVVSVQGDVRKFADLSALVKRAEADFGSVDIVIANAGIATYSPIWELSEEAWDAVIDTNLKGVWNTVRAVVPGMIERGRGGAIVLTSSVGGIRGLVGMTHYVAAKHGVTGLTRALANELAPYNIRVNSVHPGAVVDTGMGETDPTDQIHPDQRDAFWAGATGPLPGAIVAEDIANAAAWRVSDQARFVTGVQLPVDSGDVNKP